MYKISSGKEMALKTHLYLLVFLFLILNIISLLLLDLQKKVDSVDAQLAAAQEEFSLLSGYKVKYIA